MKVRKLGDTDEKSIDDSAAIDDRVSVDDMDVVEAPPTTGTIDDDDDPSDEREGENEAPLREVRDSTEAPEEFEIDDDIEKA